MNMTAMLSASAPSGASPATQQHGAKTTGAFDALVNAQACASDEPANAPASNENPDTDSDEPSPKAMAALSAETVAMLAALDRSATMLSKSQDAANSLGTDAQPVATDTTLPADADATVPSPQTAALISAFMAVGQVLPTIVSLPDDSASETNVATPLAASTPKAPLPTLPAATVPAPALFNAIAAELRPMLNAKADLAGKSVEAIFEPAKESPDGVSVVSPTSAMIRDLASMIANSVTPSSPTDGIAVDRHLDLAKGDAWLSDLANDIAATAANGGRLKFGLSPESLGRLDVEVRQGASGVSVHMTTRTDTARDVLTAAQPRIVDEIRAQGVRVAGTEVSTDASGFGGDRAGTTPRQPLAMPIDVALSAPNAAPPETAKSVADGRYA